MQSKAKVESRSTLYVLQNDMRILDLLTYSPNIFTKILPATIFSTIHHIFSTVSQTQQTLTTLLNTPHPTKTSNLPSSSQPHTFVSNPTSTSLSTTASHLTTSLHSLTTKYTRKSMLHLISQIIFPSFSSPCLDLLISAKPSFKINQNSNHEITVNRS